MKTTKLITSGIIGLIIFFCTVFLTSVTTVEKSNSENIKQLTKEISNLQKEIKTLEANISKKNSMGSDRYLAEIALFGGNFAPRGYMDCNGQLLAIS